MSYWTLLASLWLTILAIVMLGKWVKTLSIRIRLIEDFLQNQYKVDEGQ